MEESDCDYLNGMTSDMSKMVIAISNWSSDEGLDEWL